MEMIDFMHLTPEKGTEKSPGNPFKVPDLRISKFVANSHSKTDTITVEYPLYSYDSFYPN